MSRLLSSAGKQIPQVNSLTKMSIKSVIAATVAAPLLASGAAFAGPYVNVEANGLLGLVQTTLVQILTLTLVGKVLLAKMLLTTFKVVLLSYLLMVERQTLFLLVRQVLVLHCPMLFLHTVRFPSKVLVMTASIADMARRQVLSTPSSIVAI